MITGFIIIFICMYVIDRFLISITTEAPESDSKPRLFRVIVRHPYDGTSLKELDLDEIRVLKERGVVFRMLDDF